MPDSADLLLPGYWIDPDTGAWCTLPWPTDPDEKMRIVNSSLGPAIINWSEGRTDEPGLVDYKTGRPWRWTPGQKKFLILWYAVDDAGRFIYRSGVKRGAKGPIAHYTPVMTPTGWTKHGDLKVGDEVYAADGTITTVTALRPEVIEDTYRVTFRDGATVDCTGTHRWPVDEFTGSGKRVRRIMTVNDMLGAGITFSRPLSNGKTKATKGDVAKFRALPSPPVEGHHVDLPVDPYLLGYWLGDGHTGEARITAGRDDMGDFIAYLDGQRIAHSELRNTHGDTWVVGIYGLAEKLRKVGVYQHKHIPVSVMRASADQRWAVMQGIVDTDGYVSKDGRVEVCIRDNQLGNDVFELAVSLGLMPTRTYRSVTLNGKEYGPYVRIRFCPQPGEVVCRIQRKLDRCKSETSHASPFSRSRTIVGIEKIEPVPARCLTVDHPSHQYLVGEQNIPTCNTGKDPLAAAMCNTELCGPVELVDWDNGRPVAQPRRFPLVQVLSNSEAQSQDVLRVANAMWSRDAREFYGLDCGATRTVVKGTGARFEIPPSSESSGEGDPATFVALNETHHSTPSSGGSKVAAMARRNVAKSPIDVQARLVEFTNAHQQGAGSVAEESFLAWQAQQAPKYSGRKDILYDSIEAPPGTDILTVQGRMDGISAAYMDAPWIDKQRISDEMMDRRTSVADTIRYYLNGLGAEAEAWVEPAKFDALASAETTVSARDRVAMFLDCSKTTDATALVACRLEDMFVFLPGGDSVWSKPHNWQRGKPWIVDRSVVDARVRECFDRYEVCWFGVDPSPARDETEEHLYWAHVIDGWHRDFSRRLPVWASGGQQKGSSVLFDMRLSQVGGKQRNQLFTETAELVARWIDDDGLAGPMRHDGNPYLRTHVHNARLRPNPWGVSLGKVTRDSSKLVDAAVCMVGAVMGARVALNSGKLTKRRTGKACFV